MNAKVKEVKGYKEFTRKTKCKNYRNSGNHGMNVLCLLCTKQKSKCGALNYNGTCKPLFISDSCCIDCIRKCNDRDVPNFENDNLIEIEIQ